jgi:beta-glucosidase/6-phospho-beta-glucosidase/beta-galactosidase
MTRPMLLALLALAVLAPAASASSTQVMSFEAPYELLEPSTRESTLDEIQSLGVSHVRALVYWHDYSAQPDKKQKPSFNTADHTAYPAGTWDRVDALIDSLQSRKMTVQLTLTGPVPKWATKRRKDTVSDPGAKLFGKWARAVATRYGDRVDQWSIWNEPNHPQFLGPQYKDGKPHTPKLYRKLYVAGERAIHGVAGGSRDKVLFGETAPIGRTRSTA